MKNRWASIFFAVITGLVLGGCDGDDDESASVSITTTERPWIKEAEFQQDQSLTATLDQTVILDLEPASLGDRSLLLRNTLRITVLDTESLSFCIPAQEPHITVLELVSEQGATVLRVERGSNCPAVEIEAGRYTLHVIHDASTIDPPGQLAFFRRSNQPRVVLDSIEATSPSWDFFTFKGPNGKYVGLANPESNPGAVAATADTVTPATVFLTGKLGMLGSSTCTPETLSLAPFSATPVAGLAWFPPISSGNLFPDDELLAIGIDANATAVTSACTNARNNDFGACVVSFTIDDLGDYAINLTSTDNCIQGSGTTPIHLDEFNVLKLQPGSGNAATEFTVDYKGFLCGGGACTSSDLDLQAGEVAVFSECDFKGPAIVFAADVADFSVYNDAPTDSTAGFVYGIKDNVAASIMPGPDTLVELWTNPAGSSTNTVYGIPEDTACLSGTPVDGQVSQLKIVGAKQYIIDTGGCNNCNLTGVDLSSTDLSSKSFVNAIFTSANLTDASFKSAALKDADFSGSGTQLSGTGFSGAGLECTDFSNTDLTAATFGTNTFTTDFSCRLDLASATLDYSTFADDDWRYFKMTSTTVNNVPDILSSSTAPLDLSGAMLANVAWLQGKALDYVNLGCFPGTGGAGAVCPAQGNNSKVCATLTGMVLTGTSLTNACLQSAQLQGAFLEFTNLDQSDLGDAQLLAKVSGEPATLEGAFLRDVSLKNADLSGVNMSNANFFSGGATANASGATLTDAKLTGAYLAGADFASAILHGTTWTGAVLVAANFNGADLSADTSGFTSTFEGAYMEGAVFVNSMVAGVDFTDTYWDLSNLSENLNYLMPIANLQFTGYWNSLSDDECVQASYPNALLSTAGPPLTDNTNICPDGSPGACTDSQWTSPRIPFSGTGSQSQAAIDPAFPTASTCTVADILWKF